MPDNESNIEKNHHGEKSIIQSFDFEGINEKMNNCKTIYGIFYNRCKQAVFVKYLFDEAKDKICFTNILIFWASFVKY